MGLSHFMHAAAFRPSSAWRFLGLTHAFADTHFSTLPFWLAQLSRWLRSRSQLGVHATRSKNPAPAGNPTRGLRMASGDFTIKPLVLGL